MDTRVHWRTQNLNDDTNRHPLISHSHAPASKLQYPSEQSISSSIILFICSFIEVARTRYVRCIFIKLSLTGSVINSVRAGFQTPAAHTASAALSAQVITNLEVVSTRVCLRRSCPLKNVSSKFPTYLHFEELTLNDKSKFVEASPSSPSGLSRVNAHVSSLPSSVVHGSSTPQGASSSLRYCRLQWAVEVESPSVP